MSRRITGPIRILFFAAFACSLILPVTAFSEPDEDQHRGGRENQSRPTAEQTPAEQNSRPQKQRRHREERAQAEKKPGSATANANDKKHENPSNPGPYTRRESSSGERGNRTTPVQQGYVGHNRPPENREIERQTRPRQEYTDHDHYRGDHGGRDSVADRDEHRVHVADRDEYRDHDRDHGRNAHEMREHERREHLAREDHRHGHPRYWEEHRERHAYVQNPWYFTRFLAPIPVPFLKIGHLVDVVPAGHVRIVVGGTRFYYHSGVYYRREGKRYMVVPAPVGAFIRILPLGFIAFNVAATTYYYVNNTYYLWNPARDGYVVVNAPPRADEVIATATLGRIFAYPQRGQGAELQAQDRYECHRWAVSQSGVDPSLDESDYSADRGADYQRAMSACLGGRGYFVK